MLRASWVPTDSAAPSDVDAVPTAAIAKAVAECFANDITSLEFDREHLDTVESLARAKKLDRHAALLTGPFPAVVTTNWDLLFEETWKVMASIHSSPQGHDTLQRMNHLPVRHKGLYMEQRQNSLLRIFRRDIKRLRAHLQSQTDVPALVKLHGDISQRGMAEFVSSHEDFRRLVHGDMMTMQMLKMLSSDYSLMFYGFGLEDQDVLAGLDQAIEVVGDVGPHFFL